LGNLGMDSALIRDRFNWRRWAVAAGATLLVFTPILFLCAATDPMALWKIVHNRCVVDQMQHGKPGPCARVDLPASYAILKDIDGATQYLLIPTARLTGIESPALLTAGAPNYFADAWRQMDFVESKLPKPLPRQDLALAINSIDGRTQQQLHIHMDCIRRDVRDILAAHRAAIGADWAPFPEALAGQAYRALGIPRTALGGVNPFQLLAEKEPGARAAMGLHTLVLAGGTLADGSPGFILLDGTADPSHGDMGSGESLQDHQCGVASGGH
jgi:CDP-diacylglycerol pyrophosphatase